MGKDRDRRNGSETGYDSGTSFPNRIEELLKNNAGPALIVGLKSWENKVPFGAERDFELWISESGPLD
jgi:hypothetical protein